MPPVALVGQKKELYRSDRVDRKRLLAVGHLHPDRGIEKVQKFPERLKRDLFSTSSCVFVIKLSDEIVSG